MIQSKFNAFASQSEALNAKQMHTIYGGASSSTNPGCGEAGYASDLEEGLDWVLE